MINAGEERPTSKLKGMDEPTYQLAVGTLKGYLPGLATSTDTKQIIEARPRVYARFRLLFDKGRLDRLTEESFREFLVFKNNCHWNGINRQGTKICADMDVLREKVRGLHDDSRTVADRMNDLIDSVDGMSPAVVTAMLHILGPDRYGVWNETAKSGLTSVGLWPSGGPETVGEQYEQLNPIFIRLAADLEIDLWTLDALWWLLKPS